MYKLFYGGSLNFWEARLLCSKENGSLATIKGAKKQKFIRESIIQHMLEEGDDPGNKKGKTIMTKITFGFLLQLELFDKSDQVGNSLVMKIIDKYRVIMFVLYF